MYIREKLIRFLKVKNVIFFGIGIFEIALSVASMVSLISYYFGDWETILSAKRTPESIIGFVVGIALCIFALISNKMICNAYFYSSYFEGDLDGNIQYSDLTAITGISEYLLNIQLCILRAVYMKNYKFITANGEKHIELYSKKYTCECRNCGAAIEKSMYFTGTCSYCGGSDLFARVITSNRFYSISNRLSDEKKRPDFYSTKHLKARKAVYLCALCFGVIVFLAAAICCIEQISNYNSEEYLTEVLLSGTSYSSYKLIKAEILDNIIWVVVLILAVLPLIFSMAKRLKYIFTTDACCEYFSRYKRPFVNIKSFPIYKNKKYGIKSVKGAICRHYLINCSFEKHSEDLKIALARKIVKDQCPSCGASIVGAIDENYKCKYCDNLIMNVISKK